MTHLNYFTRMPSEGEDIVRERLLYKEAEPSSGSSRPQLATAPKSRRRRGERGHAQQIKLKTVFCPGWWN